MAIGKTRKTWEEKRKYVRLTAHHLLKYKVIGREKTLSFARNISAGGVLFHTEDYIQPGSIVELTINFPSYPEPVRAVSKVIRAIPLTKLGGFEIGAEFIDINGEAKEFIEKKILRSKG
jgi:c-di-GMP-binding flagellar brake protein YcgR